MQVSGELIPLGATTSMLKDAGNHIQGVVTNFQNISAIKRLSEQVRMSEHLATLGAMAAGIAHEIRNPLNSIRGFTQLIDGGVSEAPDECFEKIKSYPKIIIEEVDRMNLIVQDLLDFSRQQELTMSMVDLAEMVEQTLIQLGPELNEAGVELAEEYEPNLPATLLNSNKLAQVIFNIVRNAIQSMATQMGDKKKTIAVKVSKIDFEGRAPEISIDVTDNGSGMDEETKMKVFDPFFTTRDSGTGLGLAISQKIVRQHDGRIDIESTPGEGSTISIVLPLR